MTAPTERGLYAGVPEDVYHGDRNSVSSSQLRDLGEMTPYEFWWRRENHVRKVSEDMEWGTALHVLVLEPHRADELLIEVPSKTWNAKADQQIRKDARAAGKVALLTERMESVRWAVRNVLADSDVGHMFRDGQCELSGYYPDPETGIMRRIRPDCLYRVRDGRVIMLDLKKSGSADPGHFAKSIRTYGYNQQQPHYEDVLRDLDVDVADVWFVVVSDTAPHLVTVNRIPDAYVEHGRRRNRTALDLYAECTNSGDWPRFARGIHEIPQPTWAYREDDHL
ncbi:PD-(D/E)XK nuclease-like domain-containing protein [Nocardia sp. NPDC050630]|uniref:PD-(D/E)XK nuclease-like domain-containing protein n=1 Tax=Nocardia sp. NPDC050630 TaxID=3364321 RepID=UPI0037A95498